MIIFFLSPIVTSTNTSDIQGTPLILLMQVQ